MKRNHRSPLLVLGGLVLAGQLTSGCTRVAARLTLPQSHGGRAIEPPRLLPLKTGLEASELGVLVNDSDPQSVAVGEEYVKVREIPRANVVHLSFPVSEAITAAQFQPLKDKVDASLPATVQGLALTWTQPYSVEGMAITTAFARGGPDAQGAWRNDWKQWAYYDSDSTAPYTDYHLRPAMALAGSSVDRVRALIRRGKAADGSHPRGTVYLLNTTDQVRSLRYSYEFLDLAKQWSGPLTGVTATLVDNGQNQLGSNDVTRKSDVLAIFTGVVFEQGIGTNSYLPGAVADHLTSYGGMYPSPGQMSSVDWLDGGLTASSGTVEEPYAIAQKFSNPKVLLPRYFSGNTVLEAYAKSVWWPGELILLGDPLARPWGDATSTTYENGTFSVTTTWPLPGHTYQIQAATTPSGPFTVVLDGITVSQPQWSTYSIPNAAPGTYYRLVTVR